MAVKLGRAGPVLALSRPSWVSLLTELSERRCEQTQDPDSVEFGSEGATCVSVWKEKWRQAAIVVVGRPLFECVRHGLGPAGRSVRVARCARRRC